MDKERADSLKELEHRLGYQFREMEWLEKALTHCSFANEAPCPRVPNEVLEFLGDSVLNLVIGHLLLQRFPDAREGSLSKQRSQLVKRGSLALLARTLHLQDYLLLGKGELMNGGRMKSSILANAYEALVGAIYMDSGFENAMEILKTHFEPHIQSRIDDYKSLLQEETQRIHGHSPEYHLITESGPDHDKRFQASVTVQGEVGGVGWGTSKKEAEQEAAKAALIGLSSKSQPPNDK
jgi:ribonuclease-3